MTIPFLTRAICNSGRWLVPCLLAGLSAGCAGPAYYVQATSGHMELMRQREDVAVLLERKDTDPDLAGKLQLSIGIKSFAVESLGLPDSESYSQVVLTGGEAVTWNVVAAPEFSLEPKKWCFLVAGCVPYRGYFELEAAERFADKLRGRGYDVSVSPATAYSTLGWFEDPLLDTMFRYGEAQLAGVIFHEMAHQQLYAKGDTPFNEAFASFVEETGVRLWLESRGETERLDSWRRMKKASRQFNELLAEYRQKLDHLYNSDRPALEMRAEKHKIFEQLPGSYRHMVATGWNGNDYYSGWFDSGLNNASLALINSYRGGTCAFENLYRSAGASMRRFFEMAEEKAELDPEKRKTWLGQDCTPL